VPEIVPFTTVRRGRLIPSKCWCGTGPFPDTKRREMPNKPERRGMSIPEDPNEPAPRNANWKENSPSIPDMRKIIPLCRGDSEKRTRYPTTPVRMIATAQSRYPWTNGASRSRASATGREARNPATLPRAATRTASSPLPSRHIACAGITESAVSASGIPRNVLGMMSRKV